MDPFAASLDAYRGAFGAGAMPDLWGCDPARLDAVAKAMAGAVARGRPLTPSEVRVVTGLPQRPAGVVP